MSGDESRLGAAAQAAGGAVDAGVCRVCGATGQTGVFCDSCGAVLRTRALETAEPGGSVQAAQHSPERRRPTVTEILTELSKPPATSTEPTIGHTADVTEPVAASPLTDDPAAATSPTPTTAPTTPPTPASTPTPTPTPTPASTPTPTPTPTPASTPTPTATPTLAEPNDVRQRARELIVPVSDPAAPEQGIVPVPPGMPQPARPTVRAPELHEVAGGVPCPWCATPNPVDRHFCRRCAMNLAQRPGVIRRRWWRRLWDRRRRPIPYAGQRPRLRHGIGRLVRWAVAVAVVAVLGIEIDAHAGTVATDVQDHFAKPVQVYASSMTASSSDPAHSYRYLDDGHNNTWWGPGPGSDGTGAHIDAVFAQPINLLDVIITPGAGIEQDSFTSQSRPESMKVTLYKADGSSTQSTVTLNDTPGAQTFKIRGDDLTHVRFTATSAFQADIPGSSSELAIAEIEFFVRSSS